MIELTDPHLKLKTREPSGSIFCTFQQELRLDPIPLSKDELIGIRGIPRGLVLTNIQLVNAFWLSHPDNDPPC